ncbi:MAG: YlbF family regulator [Oscillospiraceae bacterium]|jgi:cell fate (sporulation/competence/biofilm development) regulator YlbF (YheA/YmcA/DUF963 family)|nr:YlbF family regulator [Oscillospiraceae bacterium]
MDLIRMARDFGKEIQSSDEYIALAAAQQAADEDQELQQMIQEFNLIRVKLSTAMQAEDQDEEKVKELDKTLKDTYTKVMGNPNMMQYNIAKQDVDSLMNQINGILMLCVNGEDPETCDPTAHSCGGDCSGCSGCH